MEGSGENPNFWTSQAQASEFVDVAIQHGVEDFTIFLENPNGVIPISHPKKLRDELISLVGQNISLKFLKVTKNGKIVCGTGNKETAFKLLGIKELLSVPIVPRITTDNLTTKFLLYNIPLNVTCREIAEELAMEKMPVHEVRRFQKVENGNKIMLKTVLITKVGHTLPDNVHLWYEEFKIRQFIDRPRQCGNCFQFSHSTKFCKNAIVCSRCGDEHGNQQCRTEVLKCRNCGEPHEATNKICKAYTREAEINKFKCNNHLTIMEARRRYPHKWKPEKSMTYAEATTKVSHEHNTDKQDVALKMEKIVEKFEATLQNFLSAQADMFNKMMETMMLTLTNILQNVRSVGTTDPTTDVQRREIKKKRVSREKSIPSPSPQFSGDLGGMDLSETGEFDFSVDFSSLVCPLDASGLSGSSPRG